MSTPSELDAGAYATPDDLAEVQAIVMARLDKIELEQAAAAAKHDEVRKALDDLLGEMGQMCSYLAAVAERLRANS